MSSQTPPYRRVDWQLVRRHARLQWDDRTSDPGANLRAIWRESTPIDYPAAQNAAYCRYHAGEDVVLVAEYGFLVTVIKLTDRPDHEQQYVREQAGVARDQEATDE
jgi:hypothetical protein